MSHPEKTASGPLERLPEEEIRHLLRGFPDSAIAAAIALRTGSEIENFEACLFGILMFYHPPGTKLPAGPSASDLRLHEDFGLDSISVLGAMLKIEELFDISVDHVEVAEVATISDARKLLIDKLSSAPAPHQ